MKSFENSKVLPFFPIDKIMWQKHSKIMIVIILIIKESTLERLLKQTRLLFLSAEHIYNSWTKHGNLCWFINCVYICVDDARPLVKLKQFLLEEFRRTNRFCMANVLVSKKYARGNSIKSIFFCYKENLIGKLINVMKIRLE